MNFRTPHAALGTVVKTLAWGLFIRDHPWNIANEYKLLTYFTYLYTFLANGYSTFIGQLTGRIELTEVEDPRNAIVYVFNEHNRGITLGVSMPQSTIFIYTTQTKALGKREVKFSNKRIHGKAETAPTVQTASRNYRVMNVSNFMQNLSYS